MGRSIIVINKTLLWVLLLLFGIAIWIFVKDFNEAKRSSAIGGQFDIAPSVVQEDAIVCEDYFIGDKYTSQTPKHKR